MNETLLQLQGHLFGWKLTLKLSSRKVLLTTLKRRQRLYLQNTNNPATSSRICFCLVSPLKQISGKEKEITAKILVFFRTDEEYGGEQQRTVLGEYMHQLMTFMQLLWEGCSGLGGMRWLSG